MVTLRDHTELRELVSELQTIKGFADSLHAQAHEAANQLHTVISLIELGRADEALEFATTELAVAQHLTDAVIAGIAVPELAALVVGKAAEAGERGVELQVAEGTFVPAGVADPRDLVTIVGNLLDNAIDAAEEAPAPRWVRLAGRVTGRGGGAACDRQRPGRRRRGRRARLPARLEHQAGARTTAWAAASGWPWCAGRRSATAGSCGSPRPAEFAVRLPLVRT